MSDLINAQALSLMSKYLAFFPNEKERLNKLKEALGMPTLDLGDRATIPVGHIAATGLILSEDYRQVLLIYHKVLNKWLFPGGHYEKEDRSIAEAAQRECIEETNVKIIKLHPWHEANGIPLDIDIHPIRENKKKNEGAHWHFDFRYVFISPVENVEDFNTQELLGAKWLNIEEVDQSSDLILPLSKVVKHLID